MENEKQTLSLMMILAVFVGWISPLIMFLTQKNVSDFGKDFIVKTLNFELVLFIALVVLSIVPFVNVLMVLASPAVWIFNLVICINANNAINNNTPFEYPFNFEIIK